MDDFVDICKTAREECVKTFYFKKTLILITKTDKQHGFSINFSGKFQIDTCHLLFCTLLWCTLQVTVRLQKVHHGSSAERKMLWKLKTDGRPLVLMYIVLFYCIRSIKVSSPTQVDAAF